MSEFFVDLLPDDALAIIRRRAQFRLVKLGSLLALTVATGIAVNSFVELRRAKAQHEVIVALRERSNKIDELVQQSVQARALLRSEIAADAMLRSPISSSTIISAISHLLPNGSWLESMKVSLEEQKSGKTLAASRPIYIVMMNGIAPNAQSVQEFASEIRKTAPFTAVTVLEQRAAAKTGGGSEQQFVMRARIDPTSGETGSGKTEQSMNKMTSKETQVAHGGSMR
ncbi:MAG: PilN domain-containing protein [Planctomycetota bacterium]|nr:PilN domain-containing protein [Planctomycetota bacterium]MDA1261497.1 PilN domain-containing protein [Planctomycetota bacterium]